MITGNPPYAGHSKNKGAWISAAIDEYKFVWERDDAGREVRRPLGEKNPKWLQDDYVKFIRFAQMKMDSVEEGVVGIITNHSWLDNPTFRGMRQSLSRSFEQIYALDLHGSSKPKEPTPSGVSNENVFDIQKGVAVTFLIKNPNLARRISFAEVWGSRLEKYQVCAEASFANVDWRSTHCAAPYYMCRPLNWAGWDEYVQGWSISDTLNPEGEKKQIFSVNVLGFQTHRDHFAIAFDKRDMEQRIHDMRDTRISDRSVREKYEIKDNRDWKLKDARKAIQAPGIKQVQGRLIECAFRPFDNRACFFGTEFMDYPRRELIDHVLNRQNLQLLVSRQIGIAAWRHSYVASAPAESCCVSDGSTEQNYCFPIFLAEGDHTRRENLSTEFRGFLDTRYSHHYEPEEVFGCIYSILHAPTYRTRYAEFLRIDFPRVPFPNEAENFERLSRLGWALVEAHLLRNLTRRNLAAYHGKGDHAVEFVRYSETEHSIAINKTQKFEPVPKPVWDFHIGGYQVLDKYLKSRKGRKLSLDEIDHVAKVSDALAFTIDQMSKIDDAYRAAFP